MKKKVASILLALAMVLTLVTPVSVMADTADVSIGTAEEFMAFAAASKSNTYSGKLVVLTADIDMSGVTGFNGIANTTQGAGFFEGTFDGQGHTIRNLTWTMTDSNCGFFRGAHNGAVIRNLTLENYTTTSGASWKDLRHGLLVGSHGSGGTLTVSNVHIVNGSYTNTGANGATRIGGLVGASMLGMTIENCSVEADIIIENPNAANSLSDSIQAAGVGGILGATANGQLRTIRNCSFTGTISAGRSVGGIIGSNGAGTVQTIENCFVNATINSSQQAVGGIGGYGGKLNVSGCSFTGAINATLTGTRNYAGGILGVASAANISDCIFNGDLTANGGPVAAGGIVGLASSGTITLTRCETFGSVTGTGNMMGGLVGNAWNFGDNVAAPNVLTMTDCFNTANVVFGGMSGSAVGYLQSGFTATATNCVTMRARDTKGNPIHRLFASDNGGDSGKTTNCMITINRIAGDTGIGAQTYTVTTAQQLYALARMSKWTDFLSCTLALGADIVLNAADVNAAVAAGDTSALTEWPMFGRRGTLGSTQVSPYFRGVFEGNNHVISGAYVADADDFGAGFFAWVDGSGCAIRNFTLTNSYFNSNLTGISRIAAVVGDIHTAGGTNVSNVTVTSDVTVSGAGQQVAGIVGCTLGSATITGCTFNGTAISADGYVGGIVGATMNAGPININNCAFGGSVQGTERVGGIVGSVALATNINNAVVTGTVTGTKTSSGDVRVGGVIGLMSAAVTINGLTDSATVNALNGGYDVGGVVGNQSNTLTISNANVTATVNAANGALCIGGMIGAIRGFTATVTNSRFGGTVTSTTTGGSTTLMIGGIAGNVVNNSSALIASHVLMDGALSSARADYIGGIAGSSYAQGTVTVSDSLITGTVDAPGGQVGAFLGRVYNEDSTHLKGSITSSYALDSVCVNSKSLATDGLLGSGTNSITLNGDVAALTAAQLTGAYARVNAPELDYDGYWSAIEDAVPQLKSFQTGTTADISNVLERTGASAPAAIPAGKVFGGWYADAELTVPVAEDYTGMAFAKFVDSDVMSVKSQKGLTQTAQGKTRLRVVTSVDSMDYQQVGFRITYRNASGEEKVVVANTTTAYEELIGYTNPATSVSYAPTVFSDESICFVAFRLTASDAVIAQNGDGISVQPYWITADGVTVEGETFSGIQFN